MPVYRLIFAFVLVLAGSAACSLVTGANQDRLEVEARDSSIHLRNRGALPVYHAIFEREFAARVLWGPCERPAECPAVAPGAEVRIPYDSIAGYEPGKTEAIVYWWQLLPHPGGGFRVDELRVIVVPL
jgi:hypothetical protein